MAIKKTQSTNTKNNYAFVDSNGIVRFSSSLAGLRDKGDNVMNNNVKKIDYKDLEILEQKLNSKSEADTIKLSGKIDTSEAKLSGKIDTSEAKLLGKIDALSSKLDSQNKLLYWIMGIISAGFVGILLKLFIK